VKSFARFIIFFTLCFLLTLVLSSLIVLMGRWIDAAARIPAVSIALIPVFWASLRACIPATIYITILLTMSYAVRRAIPFPLAFICLFILTVAASGGLYLGTVRAGRFDSLARLDTPRTLGAPGLILSQGTVSVVLLGDPGEERSPRLVAIPGQNLIYQSRPGGPGNQAPPLPAAEFRAVLPYFLQSIFMDFSIAALRYEALLDQGFVYFIAYMASVALLLCSLGFVFRLSVWPLANLFLGALAFRGILVLETFINSRETLEILNEYVEGAVPRSFLGTLILGLGAALILLYYFFSCLTRRREPLDG
jgi:hypothetical protein